MVLVRFALLGALVVSACATATPPAAKLVPGDAVLVLPGGHASTAARELRGHVVVIDFWASWCDECKRTIPRVERLADAYRGTGLLVVGVDAGDSEARAVATAHELGIAYPIYLDPELTLSDSLGAHSLPQILIVDRGGRVVYRGRALDAGALAAIHRLMPGATAAGATATGATTTVIRAR